MAENESKQEKNLAKDLKIEDKIKEAITTAILQDKDKIVLYDGTILINIEIIEEKQANDVYNIRVGNDNLATATRDKTGRIIFKNFNNKNIYSNFNMSRMQIIMHDRAREENKIKKELEKGNNVKNNDGQVYNKVANEVMENNIKKGKAKELEINREFSETENMRMFIKRAWGVQAQKVYRVEGKGSHDFKYVVKNSKGYKELELSTQREGTNTRQKIFVMDNGEIKEKEVDSLLIRGNYAIATDRPNSTISENTKTYLTCRTPGGQYMAISVGEKQGVNRDPKKGKIEKENMSRTKSIYQIEDVIKAAELSSKIYELNKDGKLTPKEVELVRKLKVEKNMSDQAVENIIDSVVSLKEMGFDCNQIKKITENVKIEDTDIADIITLLNDKGIEFENTEEIIDILQETKENEKEMTEKVEEYEEENSEKTIYDRNDRNGIKRG